MGKNPNEYPKFQLRACVYAEIGLDSHAGAAGRNLASATRGMVLTEHVVKIAGQ